MHSLADTLWTLVRWTVPVTVAAVVAAGAIGSSRVGEEIRSRVEARLAEEFPTLTVQVQGASLVQGEGIIVRGVSLVDPKMPQQWRQLLWIDELRLACTTNLTELASGPPRITAVQVRRPVVHAVRHADGTWNLARLWRQRTVGGLVPVSVEDATLLIDDTCRRMRATLRQVACDVQPAATAADGQAWATFRGSVAGDLFERAGFQGRFAPASGGFECSGDVESLDLSPRLAAFLPEMEGKPGAPDAKEWLAGLRGRCHLAWQASGGLQTLGDATFTVSGRLESARFQHAAIPFSLTDMTAAFRADRSGLLVESLEAHSGATLLRGSGRLAGWRSDADFDLLLDAERLTVSRQWEAHLPERYAAQWRKLLPAGEVDVRAQLVRRDGRIDPQVSVRCRNASITHYRFPYRLDRTVGTVVLESGTLSIHLTGQAGGHPVHVRGTFQTAASTGFLEVRGDGMRIDDALLAAMPPRSAAILRALHAAGTFDFVFRHDRATQLPNGFANSLGIRLAQCSMSYAGFPYPLTNVSGTLRMERGHWTIKEIVGSNDTGRVRCTGALVPAGDDDGELTLHLSGDGVVLDRELRDALPRGMGRIWDDIDPRGNVGFTATVRHRVKAKKTDVEVEAIPHADTVSIEPAWFPYRLEKLGGKLAWKDGLLRFDGVRGVHDRTTVTSEGICRFAPDGGWHVSFARLTADRFRADHEVLQAMPAGLRRAIAAVNPRGLLSLNGVLDIYAQGAPGGGAGPASAAWNMRLDMEQGSLDAGIPLEHVHGGVRLEGRTDGRTWKSSGELALDSAIWRGVQLTSVQGPLVMDEEGVRFGLTAGAGQGRARRLSARVAGGSIFADGSVSAGPEGTFAVAASVSDAELERLAGDAAAFPGAGAAQRFSGKVFGAIEVSGARSGTHSLAGRGQLRLRDADIYELPVIVALLKVLRVKAPDRKAFSSSLVDFRIEGPRAYLDNIELSGDAISLVGNGEVDFDSRVRMTFRSIMGDSETQLPVMKRVLGGASGQFMLVHVDGTLAQPDITTEAFPTLNAALQQLQSKRRDPERVGLGERREGPR
ncbi:MAG: AsmA-like C-terminal region-containing protein [Planctomycetia bacterium]|jgi:hypothetical protein